MNEFNVNMFISCSVYKHVFFNKNIVTVLRIYCQIYLCNMTAFQQGAHRPASPLALPGRGSGSRGQGRGGVVPPSWLVLPGGGGGGRGRGRRDRTSTSVAIGYLQGYRSPPEVLILKCAPLTKMQIASMSAFSPPLSRVSSQLLVVR